MATFKGIQKKAAPKRKITHQPKNEDKETLRKEEIREVVEETIEALSEEPVEEKPETVQEEKPVEQEEEHESIEGTLEKPEDSDKPQLPIIPSQEGEEDPPVTTAQEDKTGSVSSQVTPEMNTEESGVSSPVILPIPTVMSGAPTVEPVTSQPEDKKQLSLKKLFFLAFCAALIGIIVAGGLYYGALHKTLPLQRLMSLTVLTPTPTRAVPTETPTPQPVDLSKYTISVINGSGITGAASSAKSVLTSAGFTVGGTGNASTTDFTQTVISAKASVDKSYLDKLTQTLEGSYDVSSTIKTLDDSSSSDVIVTIGSSTK